MLNDSRFYDINGENFYNTAGDAHIYNAIKSSSNNSGIFTNWTQLVVQRSVFHSPDITRPLGKEFSTGPKAIRRRGYSGFLAYLVLGSRRLRRLLQNAASKTPRNAASRRSASLPLFPFCSSSERSRSARLVATLAYEITLFVPGEKEFTTRTNLDDPAIVPLHLLPGGGFR